MNFNMGCIEMKVKSGTLKGVSTLNFNMGCIEIHLLINHIEGQDVLNFNMGCIEIRKADKSLTPLYVEL